MPINPKGTWWMSDFSLDVNRKLLGLLQAEFPLSRQPYTEMGLKLGISDDEVFEHIQKLKARKIVRRISPVIDARSLGFHSTLVAMKVAESQLENAEQVIAAHPGVSHGYERDHHFNV